MADICRLCLSFSTQNMWPLSECYGVVYNSKSFPTNVPDNNLLPNHVCTICFNKMAEFNHFFLQIQKNEEILLKALEKGKLSLNNLYEQIKNQIKKESMEITLIPENNAVAIIKEESKNILNQIKTEEGVNSDCGVEIYFDSEDELPLLKTKDNLSEEKNITKIKKCNNNKFVDSDSQDRTNANSFNFKCLTCFELYASQNDLLNHYNNIHKVKEKQKENYYTLVNTSEKTSYKCNDCDKTYNKLRNIKKHAKTHSEKNFHCKICGRTYKTVSEIIRHGRAHNDGMKMSCSFGCGFATAYPGGLKSHELRHREEFKYKCDTCGKSFQVKTWFEQHQNVHTGAKPYVCKVCGMAFHMDRYLKAHCNSVHPDADATSKKRYVCVTCSKPCGTMKALTRHLKEHGVIKHSLLCDLCGKTLGSAEQLRLHRRLHLGVKPYTCSTCNKSFAKRSNLAMHTATHTGARAHPCSQCGKRYTQKSALKRHIHTHHTGNAMKCQKCDVPFTSKLELRAHQKICSS